MQSLFIWIVLNYRTLQAAYQKESAKNLFQSLKNSREHILLDISAWHQKYFGYTKRTNSNYRKKQYSRSISKKTPNSSAIPSSMPKGKEIPLPQNQYPTITNCTFKHINIMTVVLILRSCCKIHDFLCTNSQFYVSSMCLYTE